MKLAKNDLLLLIDIQNDFCPGGALAVPDGNAVVPIANQLTEKFAHVVVTQDWHPAGHSSFASSHGMEPFTSISMDYGEQTLWPDHCIQGSPGASLHPDLNTLPSSQLIRKGMNPAIDSYSAFFENDHVTSTGLSGYLNELGVKRVFCAGLAFDFCVRFSAEDASTQGFETFVIDDACRAIDMDGSAETTRRELATKGIKIISSASLGHS